MKGVRDEQLAQMLGIGTLGEQKNLGAWSGSCINTCCALFCCFPFFCMYHMRFLILYS